MGVLHLFAWNYVNYANMEGFRRDSHNYCIIVLTAWVAKHLCSSYTILLFSAILLKMFYQSIVYNIYSLLVTNSSQCDNFDWPDRLSHREILLSVWSAIFVRDLAMPNYFGISDNALHKMHCGRTRLLSDRQRNAVHVTVGQLPGRYWCFTLSWLVCFCWRNSHKMLWTLWKLLSAKTVKLNHWKSFSWCTVIVGID